MTHTRLAFLSFCILSSCSPAYADDYLDVARGIGDHLIATARHKDDGIYWQQYEGGPVDTGEENKQLAVSLYNGLAGTGYFFLNLHAVTGEMKYLVAASGIGSRLVALSRPAAQGGVKWEGKSERKGQIVPDGDGVGLYSGNAGIGLYLMQLYKAGGNERFRRCAEEAYKRILREVMSEKGGDHWVYGLRDIIGGEAGIGLSLLEMHRLTKKETYRTAAEKAGKWLLAGAKKDADGVRWVTYGCLDPNFSHGNAGIALFLSSLNNPEARAAGAGAAAWIEKTAVVGVDGIYWNYYAGELPEGKVNVTMHSWCHGTPGTMGMFIALHRMTGNAHWLDVAKKAGAGLAGEMHISSGKPIFVNPTLCCGAAGCLDSFTSLYQASKAAQSLSNAKVLADAIVGELRKEGIFRLYAQYDTGDEEVKKHPYYQTGFMLGNAGVGYALLRLSAVASGQADKLVLLPDQPFSVSVMKGGMR